MDLPVPVVGGVHAFLQRSGVEDEVVGRPVQAGRELRQDLAKRLRRRRDIDRGRLPEVGLVPPRDDPGLERRPRRVRREGHARVVLPDEPVGPARFVADESAERALAFADDEPGGAAELLGDPVRDLGQVVEVEAEVIRAGAGLGAPVLDDLQVVRLADRAGLDERVASADQELLDEVVADRVQRTMLVRWRDDRPPRAGRAGLRQLRPGRGPRSSSRASSPVPTTWNAKSLSIRTRTPSPAGVEQFAQPNRWSSTGSAARANRSRWNARSTIVATHQPVIGSLRSSNSPAAIASGLRPGQSRRRSRPRRPGRRRGRRVRPTPSTVAGAGLAGPGQLGIDGGRGHTRHPARIDELEVGQVHADVERDAVVADAALHAQAERADLARRRAVRIAPAAGVTVAPLRRSRRTRRTSRRGPPRAPGRAAAAAGRARRAR